jgi:DNA-binding transcriptional LysR family regulator
VIQVPPYLFATPPPRLPSNSNFLRPRTQFHSRLLSLSLLSGLSLFVPSQTRQLADGAASALAFVAAGFGVAVISEPLQKIPAKNVIFRDLAPEDSAWVPVAAGWKPEALTAPVASQFIDVLAQTCAGGSGEIQASAIGRSN